MGWNGFLVFFMKIYLLLLWSKWQQIMLNHLIFLIGANHLEAITQKYEWKAAFCLESGLLQLHGAIKSNTSEPRGLRGWGWGLPCQPHFEAVRMTELQEATAEGFCISSLPFSLLGVTHPYFKWRDSAGYATCTWNGHIRVWVSSGFIFVIIIVVRSMNGSCSEQAACSSISELIISNKTQGTTHWLAWVAAPPCEETELRGAECLGQIPSFELYLFDSSVIFFSSSARISKTLVFVSYRSGLCNLSLTVVALK